MRLEIIFIDLENVVSKVVLKNTLLDHYVLVIKKKRIVVNVV